MKKFKKNILSVLLALTSACVGVLSTGCGNSLELITENTQYVVSEQRKALDVHALTFDYLGGSDVMPIGTFFGPFTPANGMVNGLAFGDYCTDYYFDLLVNVGINMINYTANQWGEHKDSIQKCLDLCAEYNVGYFVQDYRIREDFSNMGTAINEYIDNDCVLGNFWRDEPKSERFAEAKETYKYYRQATDKTLYVNLFPSYQDDLTGTEETITWEEYATQFMEATNSQCLSYDHYPFEKANRGSANMTKYYSDLSIARKVSEQFGVPFWCYIQCGDIWDATVGASTVEIFPNEGEFIWNVNTCLAFGSKSITYHTFLQPYYMATTESGYDFDTMGLVGADGSINRWYYYAQKTSKQIKAIDHILMNSASVGVLTVGEDLNKNVTGSEKINGNSFRELKSFTASNDNAMIGCFDYKGKTALYVVNCETTKKQTVTLDFADKYGYEVIQRGESIKVAGKKMKLTLESGEGVLVSLL